MYASPATECSLREGEVVVEECGRDLLPGQFLCTTPDIDPATQQPLNCTKQGKVAVIIYVAIVIFCNICIYERVVSAVYYFSKIGVSFFKMWSRS